MTAKPTILVTSAAGRIGSQATAQLLAKGFPVRAMVRTADRRAEALRAQGAEVVVGDLFDPADLARATRGARRALYVPPMTPNLFRGVALFALAAEEAGLEAVALLSQWLPHPGHPSVMTRDHWLANNIARWMPTVGLTHVAPGLFAEAYMLTLGPVAQTGVFGMPLGRGRNAPPSNADIARVAVGVLADPTDHLGAVYRPTGPRLLDGEDIARVFGEVLGRRVTYRPMSETMLSKVARVQRWPTFELSQLRYYLADHRAGAFEVGAPTDHVERIGGRPAQDFAAITREYVAADPATARSLGNRLRMLATMARALATRAPDLDRWERDQAHPLLAHPRLATENPEWTAAAAALHLHLSPATARVAGAPTVETGRI